VLGLSAEDNLAPKVRYLAEELGLGRDGAAKVIVRFPSVLGLSVEENLAPKVRYLSEEWAGLEYLLGGEWAGAVKVIAIILASPTLLGMSIENKLRPTLRFAEEHFPDSDSANLASLATYSLAGRLEPRVQLLRRHGQAGRFAASTIGRLTNETFCEKVGIAIEDYDAEVAACVKEHAANTRAPKPGAGPRVAGRVRVR